MIEKRKGGRPVLSADTDTVKIEVTLTAVQRDKLDRITNNRSAWVRQAIEVAGEPAKEGETVSKNLYYAWAGNDSGASLDVNSGSKETSIRALEDAARRELGSGWKVHIMRLDFANQDSQQAEGVTEVKQFTIR